MKSFLFVLAITLGASKYVWAQNERNEVLQVAQGLLDAIEQGDTTAFRALFMPNAMIYTVREKNGEVVSTSRSPFTDTFRADTKIKERMKDRGVEVQVHDNIAQVWAPYDLWVNSTFSHCGIDVFTLIKTALGWRIAALSYTIEKTGCSPSKLPDEKR